MNVQRVLKSLGLLLLLMLPACLPMPDLNSPFSNKNKTSGTQGSANNIKIAPMTPPSEFGETPLLPGHTGRERSKDGLPMMQPARGLNTANLFSERISNPDKRTERVEVAVQEIRNDFDSMLPSLLRLVAIEKDIDSLVLQLESLVLKNPDFATPSNNPAQLSTQINTESTMPPQSLSGNNFETTPIVTHKSQTNSSTGDIMIKKVRTGIQKNAARLVIDVSALGSYSHQINESGNRLLITVPNASWASANNKTSVKNPLIKSWSIEKQEDTAGSVITVDMVPGTKTLKTFTLKAAGKKSNRIVFDIE